MCLSRRVFRTVSAIALAALSLSASAALGAKPRFGAAPAPEEGPLLAPPAVEVPSVAPNAQQAPFREESIPTWPPAQYGAPAQPQGRAVPPLPQTADGYNQIPMMDDALQAQPHAQPQPAFDPQRARNPMPGRATYPRYMGQPAQRQSPAVAPAGDEPSAVRKPPWWNPFAKREKAPAAAPQAESKSKFWSFKLPGASPEPEEAPLYADDSNIDGLIEGMGTPVGQPQAAAQPKRGWRWPWSEK